MVVIVSSHKEGFTGKPDKITGGPIYSDVLERIETCSISVVTEQCRKDVRALQKDENDIKESVIRAVRFGRFIGSEWCQINKNEVWAACDAYSFYETAWIEAAHKEMEFELYIKFCIGVTGNMVLTVSLHTPSQR